MSEKLCEICDGDGEVEYEIAVVDYEHGGYLKSAVQECHICRGYGYVEAEYLPVDGCEECEFYGVACAECIQYGEAKQA